MTHTSQILSRSPIYFYTIYIQCTIMANKTMKMSVQSESFTVSWKGQ